MITQLDQISPELLKLLVILVQFLVIVENAGTCKGRNSAFGKQGTRFKSEVDELESRIESNVERFLVML